MSEETPKEIAKAAQEASKFGQKALEIWDTYLGEISRDLIETVGYPVKTWKYKNLLKHFDKVRAIHDKRGLEGKPTPLPPRYAIQLIENVSREDNETIQNMWAALTANATDPSKQININKILIDVLSKLEPLDTDILNQFWELNFKAFMRHGKPAIMIKFLIEDLSKKINASKTDIELSLQNLNRLGCIDIPKESSEDMPPAEYSIIEAPFNLTLIGHSLMEACKK